MSLEPESQEEKQAADVPAQDARERVEAEWLLARDKNPDAPPPSAETALEYAELENLLATLPERTLDQSWHAEVLRKAAEQPSSATPAEIPVLAKAAPRRRRMLHWAVTGTAVAAVAAAAVVVVAPTISRGPSQDTRDGGSRIANNNGPGQVGVLAGVQLKREQNVRDNSGRLSALAINVPAGDFRLFRMDPDGEGKQVFRCPGDELCREIDSRLVLEVPITRKGEYVAILVVGHVGIPEGLPMLAFINEATARKLEVLKREGLTRE